ncbi:hypothetical protein FRB96_006137 [Tulasnella sp. 330]|nr:hypothetical protein FRB96_006137 [Tulasnella sp. 330]
MSAAATLHTQYPLLFQPQEGWTHQKLQQLYQRLHLLTQAGQNETNPEFGQLTRFFDQLKRSNNHQRSSSGQAPQQPPVQVNGSTPPVMGATTIVPGAPLPPLSPDLPPDPVTLSQSQLDALRNQMNAFKYVQHGLPVPPDVRAAIYPSDTSVQEMKKEVDGKGVIARVVDSAVQIHEAEKSAEAAGKETETKIARPHGPYLEDQQDSGIYPFNAYMNPLDALKPKPHPGQLHASMQQQVLVPALMPRGLDPYHILAERNRFIDARIAQRIRELSDMSSAMGEGSMQPPIDVEDEEADAQPQRHIHPGVTAQGKLRALIELKGLQLRDKQRALRMAVVSRLADASILPSDRKEYKRYRKTNIRDARTTESLERRQRLDRERRVKQKHTDYLAGICQHGQQMIAANQGVRSNLKRLSKSVLKYHADTEKEEQKRIERLAKERLKALKNDDEAAYLELVDTAKDTRITHLLKQTDTYLDSLAQAVQAQQGADMQQATARSGPMEKTDEATFGATRMEDEDAVANPADGSSKKADYYSIAHRISEKITQQPTLLVGGTLKEYQIKGLQWMVSLYNNRLNGILADEMGLGKTIQTISLVTFLIEKKHEPGPFLVIVPLSTLPNWTLEFEKWAPGVSTVVYKGSPNARKGIQANLRAGSFKVMLTTFEYIIKDRPFLSKFKWVHMIIDEGHRMKNTQSKLAQTLTQYYSTRYRLILTGTPLQNNLPELWALLNFVLPKIFNSVKSFDEWFNTPFANSGAQDNIQLNEEESLLVIRRLHKVLRPFLLRRLKKDVESELPDKVEKVIKCKMSTLQSQLYRYMKEHKMFPNNRPDVNGKPAPVKGLQNMVMQLRKICQHPYVFREVEDAMNLMPSRPEIDLTRAYNDPLIRSSGKVALLDRMLPKLFATGHRVLIFFQMTNVMDILEDYMRLKGVKCLRLDGGTKTEDRGELLKQFNAPDSEINVFMLSTRAGGLGLNLQTADTVIIYDSDWNPHADLQAQDRAHRIGQKKAVRIFRFVTEKSVEEAILTRARTKLDMDEKVIQAGRFDNKSTAEERDQYLRQLIEDQDDESQDATGDMTDEELNELLARTDEEQIRFKEMDINRESQERLAWTNAGGLGPKPDRMLQMNEIPAIYRQDNPFPIREDLDVTEGRGARVRKDVRYNDGLTDEQFSAAIENDEIDYEEYVEQNHRARTSRAGKKAAIQASGQSTPQPELEPPLKKARGRGRPSGKGASHEDSPIPSAAAKRKRMKEMSVTPSIADDDEEDEKPSLKRRKTGGTSTPTTGGLTPESRQKMKKLFTEINRVITNLTDDTGRKRCELFKELPSRMDYADYYELISNPIAISTIRKRAMSNNYYKSIEQYAQEWRTLFDNARKYNQEGSWVYIDANEMQEVFEATFRSEATKMGLMGSASGSGGGGSRVSGSRGGGGGSASVPPSMPVSDDEDLPVRRSAARKARVKDDSEDDEYAGSD